MGHISGSPALLLPGTTRQQLKNKGDDGSYVDFANIVVAFAVLGIPVIGWLLDKKVHALPLSPCFGSKLWQLRNVPALALLCRGMASPWAPSTASMSSAAFFRPSPISRFKCSL